MNLDIWLRNLSPNYTGNLVSENERYELLKYGVNALSHLPLQTQINIISCFCAIHKEIQPITPNNPKHDTK